MYDGPDAYDVKKAISDKNFFEEAVKDLKLKKIELKNENLYLEKENEYLEYKIKNNKTDEIENLSNLTYEVNQYFKIYEVEK